MNSKKMNFEIINQEAMERDIADYAKDIGRKVIEAFN